MGRLYQPLLFLLARCTCNELIRQIEWLKAENEMLRKRVEKKRIFLTSEGNVPLTGQIPQTDDDPPDHDSLVCSPRLSGILT